MDCEGYKHFFRASTVWRLFLRKQTFTNWYTKLHLVCIKKALVAWVLHASMTNVAGETISLATLLWHGG